MNKIGKSCFQHDMTYGNFKNLPRSKTFDKVLYDKTFNKIMLKIQNMIDTKEVWLQWFLTFLIKSADTFGGAATRETMSK